MVSFLSKWIEEIAITVIIAGIIEMILPNGNLRKYIKVVLGIYIIFSIISPFVNKKSLYSFNTKEFEKLGENIEIKEKINDDTNNNFDKIYKETFEKDIKEYVETKGFSVYRCYIDGSFELEDAKIEKITIFLNEEKEEENINQNEINVEKIEKVEINVNTNESKEQKQEEQGLEKLRKDLSEHYELQQSIFEIRIR